MRVLERVENGTASTEVPSLGRGLGKVVCSAVNALADHAS